MQREAYNIGYFSHSQSAIILFAIYTFRISMPLFLYTRKVNNNNLSKAIMLLNFQCPIINYVIL